ncbi:LacI family DNA-binding transcriptional regulator [Martelella soudanensis]|uniref:LacI family DNA-binding transcriptional regulator n=1 Tax=unclassified Martelella TaxID=2629616 RepID=UPI0015DE6A92|nr:MULTISPECIES: LacI family DNA-binding transcriptional regulator [unclassified Martelella]
MADYDDISRNLPEKPQGRRSPTIADIAKLAGVSPSTVSRSLAGNPRIGKETRKRIADVARDLGYTVNRHARSLRMQKSGILLVLIPDIANLNYSDLLMQIDRIAHERGYDIRIGHIGVDTGRVDRQAEDLFTGGIDGILLTSDYCPSNIARHVAAGEALPVVRTLSPTGTDEGIAGVQIDEEAAAFDAVSHLLRCGHRRIAHLAGSPGLLVSRLRMDGWRRALENAGEPISDEIIGEGFAVEDGRRAARALIAGNDYPDAVFCANDLSAYGLMSELQADGVRIPEDIAVAGFDDLSFSSLFSPPLTTIRLPRRDMAEASIRYLVDLIDGKDAPSSGYIPHQLVIRKSTGSSQ